MIFELQVTRISCPSKTKVSFLRCWHLVRLPHLGNGLKLGNRHNPFLPWKSRDPVLKPFTKRSCLKISLYFGRGNKPAFPLAFLAEPREVLELPLWGPLLAAACLVSISCSHHPQLQKKLPFRDWSIDLSTLRWVGLSGAADRVPFPPVLFI